MRGALCGLTVALAGAAQYPHDTIAGGAAAARDAPLSSFSPRSRQTRDLSSNSRSWRGQLLTALHVRSSACGRAGSLARRRCSNSPAGVWAGGGVCRSPVGAFGGRQTSSRPGVTWLEGKKSKGGAGENQEMDKDMRLAAKELEKMEENKKRKREVKATRRAGPAPVVTPFRGDEQDDVVAVSKSAGANPFKKDKIVSKFDVSDIRKVEFVGSYVDDESAWPKTSLPEIAFLGRSNVGKSSMLNTLFGEAVAKVSKTPGRTRQINIFKAKNSKGKDVCYFADLPGYGYAKMGKETQRTIEPNDRYTANATSKSKDYLEEFYKTFMEMYLARRANLKLLVLLVDSRREPLSADAGVLEYAEDREDRPYKILVVATKVDKLNPMESVVNIKRLQEAYDLPPGLPVMFSAITGTGKKELWSYIRQAAAAKS